MNKEQQKQLIIEIMDLDAKDGLYEDDVQKLAEQYVNTNYPEYTNPKEKAAAIEDICWGYNKAKETLYTEEDIDNILSMYADDAPASYIKRDYKKYLQSLKQPKKH